jgi:hypothetical protein
VLSSANALGRNPFTLFNADTAAAGCPAFSAFLHSAHTAFSLRANAEARTTDYNTDTRRRRALLNDPASFRGRFLNDVVLRKARRNNESYQGGTNKNCAHWEGSPSVARTRLLIRFHGAWFRVLTSKRPIFRTGKIVLTEADPLRHGPFR